MPLVTGGARRPFLLVRLGPRWGQIPLICSLGARRELPTLVELEAIRRLKPVVVRVSFLDQRYIMVPVDSWTTAEHLHTVACRRLGIRAGRGFGIYEVNSKDEERLLDGSERLLDMVAYWTRLATEERGKKGKGAETDSYHFVFKARLFLEHGADDDSAVEMMFMQACHDIVDGRYPCGDSDAITLAALQVTHSGAPSIYIVIFLSLSLPPSLSQFAPPSLRPLSRFRRSTGISPGRASADSSGGVSTSTSQPRCSGPPTRPPARRPSSNSTPSSTATPRWSHQRRTPPLLTRAQPQPRALGCCSACTSRRG